MKISTFNPTTGSKAGDLEEKRCYLQIEISNSWPGNFWDLRWTHVPVGLRKGIKGLVTGNSRGARSRARTKTWAFGEGSTWRMELSELAQNRGFESHRARHLLCPQDELEHVQHRKLKHSETTRT